MPVFTRFFEHVAVITTLIIVFYLLLHFPFKRKAKGRDYRTSAAFLKDRILHAVTHTEVAVLSEQVDDFQQEYYDENPQEVTELCIDMHKAINTRRRDLYKSV